MSTLGDYIAKLQALEKQVGSMVEVEKWLPAKGRHTAPDPCISYARRYSIRHSTAFYHEPTDTPAQKGQMVIRV